MGWPFALAILAGAVPLGCYKPNIKDGGLKCNLDAGVGKSCPEGFKCDMSMLTCWRNPDGGVDRPSPDVPDGRVDGPVDMKPDVACFEARPSCTPSDAGICDPYCQTGCPCGEKCSINTGGMLTCNPPRAPGFPKLVTQDCRPIDSVGDPAQTDNCAPGLVCLDDGCYPRCFQFCRVDADCPTSACTRELPGQPGGQKVCELPFMDTCVPLPGGQNTGCGSTIGNVACTLSSTNPTHTMCDCPTGAAGANVPCTRSNDCIKGLVCVDRNMGTPTCLQVCKLSNNGSDCVSNPTAGACHPYTGIPAGQTPNPTYGFCL
jgi:hypothetical protein